MSKLKLAIVFGGKSTEHEISILSTRSILAQIDSDKYNISLLRIDIKGNWFLVDSIDAQESTPITLVPQDKGAAVLDTDNGKILKQLDIALPVLHGVFGEDGTIQGYFRMMNLAFVGCDVMASSACMDKDLTKRVLRDAGIGIAPYAIATPESKPDFAKLERDLGTPLFIKPANLGSSVGVFKIETEAEYLSKLDEALTYDWKVLIEKTIVGREIECAVLGNEKPKASLPGEVIMSTEFYDFESKYVDQDASSTQVPADIPDDQIELVRSTAIKAYQAMGCEGLSRVDFFVTDEEVLINEINTIPGFTSISMYPKMWEATGIPYPELIDILIELGMERYQRDAALKITAQPVK
ncbi:D-alanine--D-alanine ligase family protein [Roseivirga sp. E12]|uniref:D-alanine--D-alanine ligase family protein n=1 Tax=Roseivirga sp. E12 TaxID=2819237 RepID=UPI001ABC84FA|nr:D-alanine--D-alanine ligase family protein [Roseivirga sp. E12]MBO3700563.1 D-alanine--D-alanine ligase [Roseivirga sp. E12]